MKTIFILFSISLFIIYSCDNNVELDPVLMGFEKVEDAEIQSINMSPDLLGDPFGIIIIDSLALMLDPDDKTYLNIYDIKNNKNIGRHLSRGSGPNELISPVQLTRLHGDEFSVFCTTLQRYINFSVSLTANNLAFEVKKNVVFKRDKSKFYRVLPFSNEVFVGTGIIKGGKYAISDSDGNLIEYKYDYPLEDPNYNGSYIHKGLAYQCELGISPDYSNFVMVYDGIFEIFEIYGNTFNKIKSKNYFLPDYTIEDDGLSKGSTKSFNYRYGFRTIACSNNFIYSVYSGELNSEAKNAIFGKEILIFDWNGKPIKRIKVGYRMIDIAIDNNEEFIYAIIHNPLPEIIKIKI